jgi:hypothetical protein
LTAQLEYIRHSGVDLYQTLLVTVMEHAGRLPIVSLDTIEPRIVSETFRDLGLEQAPHLFPLDRSTFPQTTDDIVAFHRELVKSGSVELALTCLASVAQRLVSDGIPVRRIKHTTSSVREALVHASLAARLAESRAAQAAVAIIEISREGAETSARRPTLAVTQLQLRVQEALLGYAEGLRGTLAPRDAYTFVVHMTRGTVENAINRFVAGHASVLEQRRFPVPVSIGFGIGSTVHGAEDHAWTALARARETGDTHVVYADGKVFRAGKTSKMEAVGLRQTNARALERARSLGLGPLALRRLTDALLRADPSAITAKELGEAYGVGTRSARRLLKSLERGGFAEQHGRHVGAGPGRPQTVFRVDLTRLADGDSEGSLRPDWQGG